MSSKRLLVMLPLVVAALVTTAVLFSPRGGATAPGDQGVAETEQAPQQDVASVVATAKPG